jgi:hypothetical protein
MLLLLDNSITEDIDISNNAFIANDVDFLTHSCKYFFAHNISNSEQQH